MPPVAIGAVAVGATLYSISQEAEAANTQKRANRAKGRLSELRQQREKQRTVREARLARAEVTAQAVAQGISGSSAEAGAQAGISTKLASNISFLDTAAGFQEYIGDQEQEAADTRTRAGIASAVGSIAGQASGRFK